MSRRQMARDCVNNARYLLESLEYEANLADGEEALAEGVLRRCYDMINEVRELLESTHKC